MQYIYDDPTPVNERWRRQLLVLGIKPDASMTIGQAKTMVAQAIGDDATNRSCYKSNQLPVEDWQAGPMEALGEPVTDATSVEDFRQAMKHHGFRVYQTSECTMKNLYYWTWIEYDPYVDAVKPTLEDVMAMVDYADWSDARLDGRLADEAPEEGNLKTMLALRKKVKYIIWKREPRFAYDTLVVEKDGDGFLATLHFSKQLAPPETARFSTIDEILAQWPEATDDKWCVR